MADYIEREKAFNAVLKLIPKVDDDGYCWVIRGDAATAIDSIPAADVRPVVRGKWKRLVDFTGVEAFGYKETMIVGYGCNACGYKVDVSEGNYNFCPNCGADMREEQT